MGWNEMERLKGLELGVFGLSRKTFDRYSIYHLEVADVVTG